MQQSVTFDLGSASGNTISLDVRIVDDLLVEGTESFTLSGRVESGSSGAVFSQATLTIPILDNDGTFHPFYTDISIYSTTYHYCSTGGCWGGVIEQSQ